MKKGDPTYIYIHTHIGLQTVKIMHCMGFEVSIVALLGIQVF